MVWKDIFDISYKEKHRTIKVIEKKCRCTFIFYTNMLYGINL